MTIGRRDNSYLHEDSDDGDTFDPLDGRSKVVVQVGVIRYHVHLHTDELT